MGNAIRVALVNPFDLLPSERQRMAKKKCVGVCNFEMAVSVTTTTKVNDMTWTTHKKVTTVVVVASPPVTMAILTII
eukprot:scaffold481_cov63-Attheya_sp.AAC.2